MLIDVFLLPAFYFVPADVDRLIVRTDPAVVSVTPVADKRELLELPDLEFQVRVVARCGSGRTPDSISISIADTRVSFGRDSLSEDAVLETSIGVTARWIVRGGERVALPEQRPGDWIVARRALDLEAPHDGPVRDPDLDTDTDPGNP